MQPRLLGQEIFNSRSDGRQVDLTVADGTVFLNPTDCKLSRGWSTSGDVNPGVLRVKNLCQSQTDTRGATGDEIDVA